MNLFLRLLYVLLTLPQRPSMDVLDIGKLTLMTFPNDLDVYGHMNNGRYQTLMDLGRIDLIMRTGLYDYVNSRGWNPLVAAVKMDYKRPLKVFQKFDLRTRILGWDEKWFFLEQTFKLGEKEIARGLVKGLFRGPEGSIPTQDVLRGLGKETLESPTLPSELTLL